MEVGHQDQQQDYSSSLFTAAQTSLSLMTIESSTAMSHGAGLVDQYYYYNAHRQMQNIY